jgi:LuxR family transcriptional regulator, regulator of acetate metabolism
LPIQDRPQASGRRPDRRLDSLGRVRAALGRLRGVKSVDELLNRATTELCRSCGFDRAVMFRVDGSELVTESAYFRDGPDWAREFVELGRQVRPQLNELLIETEMIKHHRPVLVADPQNDPRSFKPLVQAVRTTSYVAAPIMPNGRVIGMLHADRYTSGEEVDEIDLETIWTFAEGFGYAVERMLLVERLEAETAHIREMANTATALIEELRTSDLELTPRRRQSKGWQQREPVPAPHGLAHVLTRRELQVIELMASGASNAEIADNLVISVGTVKSHVKHILRKLRAANRAEAVSRYFRLAAQV